MGGIVNESAVDAMEKFLKWDYFKFCHSFLIFESEFSIVLSEYEIYSSRDVIGVAESAFVKVFLL